jgi:predicted DNA-binding transcriptional regulator AlpA
MALGELESRDTLTPKRGRRKSVIPADTPITKLLTPNDVAEITGLSVETLAQWRSQKRGIPYVKISHNCVRYRQVDVDQWVRERIVRVELEPLTTVRRS